VRAIVTGTDQALGTAIAARLAGAAATVVPLTMALADRDACATAVARALSDLGGLDLLVLSGWSPTLLAPMRFEDIDDASFGSMWEGGMQGMLWTVQAAIPALRASSGSVVVVLPTTGMTGAANYAAAAATFEGQRILMKAAARQLGPEGIRVNAVAVGAELVLDDVEAADVHYLAPNAILGEQSGSDVADIVAFLASGAGSKLGGQTITIDGGRWLAP